MLVVSPPAPVLYLREQSRFSLVAGRHLPEDKLKSILCLATLESALPNHHLGHSRRPEQYAKTAKPNPMDKNSNRRSPASLAGRAVPSDRYDVLSPGSPTKGRVGISEEWREVVEELCKEGIRGSGMRFCFGSYGCLQSARGRVMANSWAGSSRKDVNYSTAPI